MELAVREEEQEEREYPTKQSSPQPPPYESAAINALISTLPSVESQRFYPLRLKPFFELASAADAADDKNDLPGPSLGEKADQFVKKARENPQRAYDILIKYVSHGKRRVNIKKDLAAGTLQTNFNTIKSFYECNDLVSFTSPVPINWKRIEKGLPRGITKANDRSYTVEEIYKLVEHSDRRMKMVVYIMCSSGIRAGALLDLRLKHVKPITDDKTGEVVAAKLTVYTGTRDQYFTFVSQEAYNAIQDYIEHRKGDGEKITENSWLNNFNMPTISLMGKKKDDQTDDDDHDYVDVPQINIALIRLLMVLSKAGDSGMPTQKLLKALRSSHHGQDMIKLGVKKGYVERVTVPQPKGKKGNDYVMNRLTPKGERFLSKLGDAFKNNSNNKE